MQDIQQSNRVVTWDGVVAALLLLVAGIIFSSTIKSRIKILKWSSDCIASLPSPLCSQNDEQVNYQLEKNERDGGTAKLLSSEARTVLSDNAKRTWGASRHRNGAFYPPDQDYFTRPSAHAPCANPVSSLKSAQSAHVHAFGKAVRPANAPVEVVEKHKMEAAARPSKPQVLILLFLSALLSTCFFFKFSFSFDVRFGDLMLLCYLTVVFTVLQLLPLTTP